MSKSDLSGCAAFRGSGRGKPKRAGRCQRTASEDRGGGPRGPAPEVIAVKGHPGVHRRRAWEG
eukprot:179527-Pyramimonas_sp.AAC.1